METNVHHFADINSCFSSNYVKIIDAKPVFIDEEKYKNDLFSHLINDSPYFFRKDELQQIRKALDFAFAAHKGQYRKVSKEPYIVHPVEVAKITIKELQLRTTSAIAALLHDVVEDTEYSVEDIRNFFGEKVANIVEGLTKIQNIYDSKLNPQAEMFKNMLLTIPQDMRVIFIKLADRLHNMRTMEGMPASTQLIKSGENLFVYAPFAGKLGLYLVKKELEDLSFKYSHPEKYNFLVQKISETDFSRCLMIEDFVSPLRGALESKKIKHTIISVEKSLYSVWEKMEKESLSFEDVFDYKAVRIIIDPQSLETEREECFSVYSIISSIYSVRKGSMWDFVKNPKENGFEGLLLDFMTPCGQWLEVQILTQRMHEIAERGYSDTKKPNEKESERDKWIRNIVQRLQESDSNAFDLLDNFRLNVYSDVIYVFTPKGQIIKLPKNSTILDFAFQIHTDIGLHCAGGKVNHKMVPVNHVLNSTDQVDIISSESVSPKSEWQNFVVSPLAKGKLKKYFIKIRKQDIESGALLFQKWMREWKIDVTPEVMTFLIRQFNVENDDDFLIHIANNKISAKVLEKVLFQEENQNVFKYFVTRFFPKLRRKTYEKHEVTQKLTLNPKEPVLIDENIPHTKATCCNPLPGDDATAFKNHYGMLIVHRTDCQNSILLRATNGKQVYAVKWKLHKNNASLARVLLKGIDRIGMTKDITNLISDELKVNIRSIHLTADEGIFDGTIDLYVLNLDDLNVLISKLKKINGVKEVFRTEIPAIK